MSDDVFTSGFDRYNMYRYSPLTHCGLFHDRYLSPHILIMFSHVIGTRLSQRYRRQKESNPAYRMERLLNLVTLKATQLESVCIWIAEI